MTKFVSTITYKPLVGILPHFQLRCTWEQRWTDYILRSKVKVTAKFSGEGIPIHQDYLVEKEFNCCR